MKTITISPEDANMLYLGFDTEDFKVLIKEPEGYTFNILVECVKTGKRYIQTNHCRLDLKDDFMAPSEIIHYHNTVLEEV